MISFIVGFIIGGIFGVFTAALIQASSMKGEGLNDK